ncbi:MAG: cyanoexosortase C [Cyanobacteria bacterium CRU_2_1]|nr:cyanoexosortase C [Cyanobacteria bacterium CRU_2_1]
MKRQNKQAQAIHQWIQNNLKTHHGRILLCGLAVVLGYSVFWSIELLLRSLKGSSSGFLQIAGVGLGLYELWQRRHWLEQMTASEEDRLLGHILTLSGAFLLPICLFQGIADPLIQLLIPAIVCALVLAGIACSCWGVDFFKKFPLPIFLICMGLLPKPAELSRYTWQAFTSPEILERLMAWCGMLAFRAIGQPAVAEGTLISLPDGTVDIGWGCNGFDMAATMAVASLVLGLFLKQSHPKILMLMLVGAVLALISNIPRIMLVTIAAVYWDKKWFVFWHDSWGSQIFVSILFTIYYYLIMWIIKQQPRKSRAH